MWAALLITVTLPFACQSARVGGYSDNKADVNDPQVVFALDGINAFYQNNNIDSDDGVRTTEKVINVQTQVVAGINWKMTLQVKSLEHGLENCDVTVWSQPWLKHMELTNGPVCTPVATKRQLGVPGGVNPVDVNKEGVKNALAFAVERYNAMTNSLYLVKSGNVGQVTEQVVAGMLYEFTDVEMSTTSCTKGDANVLLENCAVPSNANTQKCSFTILWQAWQTPQYKFTDGGDITCN